MGTGERKAIPKEEWSDLSFAGGVGDFGGLVVATTRPGLQGAHFWAELKVARGEIEALSEEVDHARVDAVSEALREQLASRVISVYFGGPYGLTVQAMTDTVGEFTWPN